MLEKETIKFVLNNNAELVKKINKLLDQQKENKGARYCPSKNTCKESDICPCDDFVYHSKVGEQCECGKYIKKQNWSEQ